MANVLHINDHTEASEAISAAVRTSRSGKMSKVTLAGLGLLGLVFGGIPIWAARRIIHPISFEPATNPEDVVLDIDAPAVPEHVRFEGRSGEVLSGWFVPGPASVPKPWPAVLLVHGYGGYKEQMVGYARMLHEGGFASMMFDMRGSGLLRGQPVTLGYKERWDLLDALNYLRSRPDVDAERLGVLGVSMGAATALLAAAEEVSIKAVVADSAYAGLADMIKPGIRAFIGPTAIPLSRLIVFYAETMLGMKSADIKPDLAAVQMGNRPLLVIHGCNDPLVPTGAADRIYNAATGPKELWMVPNCGHALGPLVAYDEYQRRVNDFFHRWLGSSDSGARPTTK